MNRIEFILLANCGLVVSAVFIILARKIIKRRKLRHQLEHSHQETEQYRVEPCCGNCKHANLSYKDDPCSYCENCDEWESSDENARGDEE